MLDLFHSLQVETEVSGVILCKIAALENPNKQHNNKYLISLSKAGPWSVLETLTELSNCLKLKKYLLSVVLVQHCSQKYEYQTFLSFLYRPVFDKFWSHGFLNWKQWINPITVETRNYFGSLGSLSFNHLWGPVLIENSHSPFNFNLIPNVFSLFLFYPLAEWNNYRWPWKWEYLHLMSWANSWDWALIPELLFTLWNIVKIYFWELGNSIEMFFFLCCYSVI